MRYFVALYCVVLICLLALPEVARAQHGWPYDPWAWSKAGKIIPDPRPDPSFVCPTDRPQVTSTYGPFFQSVWKFEVQCWNGVQGSNPRWYSSFATQYPEGCPNGGNFNATSGVCEVAPDCPDGYSSGTFQVGSETSYFCIPDYEDPETEEPEQPETCDVQGYGINTAVCAEERDNCLNAGGSFGIYQDQVMCVPSQDPEPDLPDCGNDGLAVVRSDGSHYCTPLENQPRDLSGLGNPGEEGGGIYGPGSDSEDPDPPPRYWSDEGSDPDDPPPSIPPRPPEEPPIVDPEDPNAPGGNGGSNGGGNGGGDGGTGGDGGSGGSGGDDGDEPNDTPDSVSGGGNCSAGARPSCSGNDPIGCAILIQAWSTRCALEAEGELPGELDNYEPDSLTEEIDAQSTFGDIFSPSSTAGSCPAPESLSVAGTSLQIEFTPFCDLAGFLRPVVLFLFGLIGLRILMRGFA